MIAVDSFAPEFSVEVLRRRYADLAGLDDRALVRHYAEHGEAEGRVAADVALREAFVAMAPPETALLEIGPFCQPVFTGPNVRYLDILDAESLRRRAVEIGIDPAGCPQTIHYNHLEEAAGAQLDVIFSSHNLEHQPDLVGHFQQAAAALKPGGLYMILVPDKRYCFDHFLPETTLSDVLGAYAENRTVHAPSSVIEHVAFTCHNDILRHWRGDHGPAPTGLDGRVEVALQQIEDAAGGYIDVHAWQFTPASFRGLMAGLQGLNLSPFTAARVYDTPWGRNEFAAVLARGDA
jgi:SAM-dependent methyltransferase